VWHHKYWRFRIYDMIACGKEIPSFSDIARRNHETFKWIDLVFCFAYIDFMIFYDQEKWIKFQEAQRQCKKPAEAMEKVYDWSPLMFEELFKEWILENYPRSKREDDNWEKPSDNPRHSKNN
ncbi:hypothetical protein ACFL54_05665, partial [Planctomycetota bacterium]